MQYFKPSYLKKATVIACTSLLLSGCAAFKPHLYTVDEWNETRERDPHWSFNPDYLFNDQLAQNDAKEGLRLVRKGSSVVYEVVKQANITTNQLDSIAPDTASFYVVEPNSLELVLKKSEESEDLDKKLSQ